MIFGALWQAFLPMLVLSAGISFWYIRKYHPLLNSTSTRDLRSTIEQHSNKIHQEQDENKDATNYILGSLPNKWLAFGGNFYGLMCLYYYLIIEYRQFAEFFAQFTSFADLWQQIGLDMIIAQLVQALTNFFYSFAWPYYWMGEIVNLYARIFWIALAYGGFLLGLKAALHLQQKKLNQK